MWTRIIGVNTADWYCLTSVVASGLVKSQDVNGQPFIMPRSNSSCVQDCPSPVQLIAGKRCIPGCQERLIVKCRVFGLLLLHWFACASFHSRYVNQAVSPSSFHQKSIPSLMKCACVVVYHSRISGTEKLKLMPPPSPTSLASGNNHPFVPDMFLLE